MSPTRPRQILAGAIIATAFLGALLGSAWLGVAAARRTLPEGLVAPTGPAVGEIVSLDATEEPLYLATSVQPLRDFFFSHQDADSRREGDAEARDLRRVFEGLEVRIVDRDADARQVEVIDGPLRGLRAWVHQSQLPPPVPRTP